MKIHYLALFIICLAIALFTFSTIVYLEFPIVYTMCLAVFLGITLICLVFANCDLNGNYYQIKFKQKANKKEIKDALLQRMKDAPESELSELIKRIEEL